MAFERIDAIVINASKLGEADKIVTFFSKDYGKIQGIARGIRKIRSKYSGKLELFNRVAVIFFHKAGHLERHSGQTDPPLLKITQVDMVEAFTRLHDDFHKIVAASCLAELINKGFEKYDNSHKPVYGLLCETLRQIEHGQDIRMLLPAFEVKILAHLGYTPVLDRCIHCGKLRTRPTASQQNAVPEQHLPAFHLAQGGILCPRCKRLKKGAVNLNPQSIECLQHFLETRISQLQPPGFSVQAYQDIRRLLTGYLQYHLGISLKTDGFVKKLRSTGTSIR
ncbi:DNA repair protein RecO [candidate division KSB3 bacterium]|uniref:DNA repair protein RecO n=1 Tax=candidate division KSB3 bacterium TaxID=2044937 RepID=A0A2G6E669_9BACT|nr:MAG: DNA repair protein RecO [candidate division KSB3 bacterium]PIE30017.1 MAG: DNA repair protein RecO [candidate division KSB3 bacterium]